MYVDQRQVQHPGVGKHYYEVFWESDGAGAVPATKLDTRDVMGQFLYSVKTTPGTGAATPASYTVTLTDDDGWLVDQGLLAGRSTAVVENTNMGVGGSGYPLMHSGMTLNITGAGANHSGKITLIFSEW